MSAVIELLPVAEDDREFLYRVYASTRADELAAVPWDRAQKEAFLRAQFDAGSLVPRAVHPGHLRRHRDRW